MNSLTAKIHLVDAQNVNVSEDTLAVDLVDGRTIAVPLVWYPRLWHSTGEERNNWELIGAGMGIHWPDCDEDISVANLLGGQPSTESQPSFSRWLQKRKAKSESTALLRPKKAVHTPRAAA